METISNEKLVNTILPKNSRYLAKSTCDKMLENDYQRQAIEFLYHSKTTCEIFPLGLSRPTWSDRGHNSYKVVMQNSKHKFSFTYYDSIANTEKKVSAKYDFYSVLACMTTYCPESFDEFCSDFGYEFKNESECLKVKSTHLEILAQISVLKKMFTEEELEALGEIS